MPHSRLERHLEATEIERPRLPMHGRAQDLPELA
jgi:hypothetical protein